MKLLRGLAKILIKIGRWLLGDLLEAKLADMLGYLRRKAARFSAKAKAAKTEARRAWLRMRARNWNAAATWLADHWPDAERLLDDAAARAAAGIDKIPRYSADESFRRWRRKHG